MHAFKCDDGLQVLGQYHGASRFALLLHIRSLILRCSQREDLEFSVGSKAAVWEVKDPLLAGQDSEYAEDVASNYHGAPGSLVGGISGKQLYQQKGYSRGYPPSSDRY